MAGRGDLYTEQKSVRITVTASLPVEDTTDQFSSDRATAEPYGVVSIRDREDAYLACMHIKSGCGRHWFLDGPRRNSGASPQVKRNIGRDSRPITGGCMSDVLYRTTFHPRLVHLICSSGNFRLFSTDLVGISILGFNWHRSIRLCSRCSVSFLGLRTEFPIIICSLAAGTDTIIGTDVL